MNSLLNALDSLSTTLGSVETPVLAGRMRRFLITLLHDNEFTLSRNDPNHPYTRFAKNNDSEGNRQRLFQAIQEFVEDGNSDLRPCLNLMFEVPGHEAYDNIDFILRRYRRYSASTEDSSDGDSDSS